MKTKTKTRYEVQFKCGEATKVIVEAYTPRQAYRIAKRTYTMDGPVLVRNPRTNTYWLMTEVQS